jgi:mono/diheme cytochrome c family protein
LKNIVTTSPRNVARVWAVLILLGIALATGLSWPGAARSRAGAPKQAGEPVHPWAKVSVELPKSPTLFPPGTGADIAISQCLTCHSAEMVLLQPALTQSEWAAEINKMRNSFGARLPADQVEALVEYLHNINGRQSPARPSVVDGQGS